MTHPRKLIRDATAAAIVAGATAAADRVWASREPPVNVETVLMEQGPVILIYTRHDKLAKDGQSGQGFGWEKREVALYIEITAASADVLDDKLDAMAEQVEIIMDTLEIPNKPGWEIRYVETTIDTTQEFEQPVGGALIEYEVCYTRIWRPEADDTGFPCDSDVGVKINDGPREAWPMACEDHEP